MLKQSKQWALFSERFAHGPHAEGPEIPPAVTSTFIQLSNFVNSALEPCISVLFYNLFLQELVKHTTDAKDKENLRLALDAMRVSVYVFLLTCYSYDISIDLSCVSRTWRSVSTR